MEGKAQIVNTNTSSNRIIYCIGGWVSMILIAYSLVTMLLLIFLGGYPATIEECYKILIKSKFLGLLRLDILTVLVMPLYYLFFYSLFTALKRSNNALASISIILIFAGLTLFLSSPSAFSLLHLSDKYADAISQEQKNHLLAAGEAILAADIWHGTPAVLGGLLMQAGALIISFLMLQSKIFTRLTAFTGIFVYGLDLLHIIFSFFLPTVSFIMMAIAGPIYLLWFPLVGLRLMKLDRNVKG